MIGEVVGSYRVVRQLGKGGMGAVYLAEHTLIGRPAAVKVLLPRFSEQPEIVGRFFNEAKATTAIRHPGIVEIYDFGYRDDGSAFIVMEYLEGETLRDVMRRPGGVTRADAVEIIVQVAGALAAAHDAGIVHRDLKPANVILISDPDTGGQRIKLLDFGIAKLASEPSGDTDSVKTQTGVVMGTPHYMAPEQCKGASEVDHRADLYALGCILFKMTCGRPPFVARGGGEVLAQHIYAEPPRPSELVDGFDPAVEAVILRLLRKEPDERFASARELRRALSPEGTDSRSLRALPAEAAQAADAARARPGTAAAAGAFREPAPTRPLSSGASPEGAETAASADIEISVSPPTTHSAAAGAVQAPAKSATGRRLPLALAALAGAGALVAVAASIGSSSPSNEAPERSAVATPAGEKDAGASADFNPRDDAKRGPAAPADGAEERAAPPEITVRIESEPAGAAVFREPRGIRVGTTPYEASLPRADGELEFVVKKRGYEDAVVTLGAGEDGVESVALERTRPRRSRAPRRRESTEAPAPTERESRTTERGTLDPFSN